MPTTWDAGAGLCMSMGKQPSQCLELGRCSLTVSSTTPYPPPSLKSTHSVPRVITPKGEEERECRCQFWVKILRERDS